MRRLLAPLLLATALHGTPPEVSLTLDRTDVVLGDRVVATYTAKLPEGATLVVDTLVTPAPPADAPEGAHVLEYELPSAPKVEKGSFVQTVGFSPFALGEIDVPGPYLVYVAPTGQKETFRGPSTRIRVASRLPQDKKPEELAPRAERATRIPALSRWFWASLAAALLLVAGLVYWLIRRRRRKGAVVEPEKPRIPPDQELILALDALEKSVEALGSDARPFYSELTHVVKRYLERRLSLPILEWTTFETVRKLRDEGLEMPREIGLPELLGSADRVKFGKGTVTRTEAREHVGRARLLKDHLESRLAAAAARQAAQTPVEAAAVDPRRKVS